MNSLQWTSRYGSVVVSGSTEPGGPIDAVFDGVNERGLAANLLYESYGADGVRNLLHNPNMLDQVTADLDRRLRQ